MAIFGFRLEICPAPASESITPEVQWDGGWAVGIPPVIPNRSAGGWGAGLCGGVLGGGVERKGAETAGWSGVPVQGSGASCSKGQLAIGSPRSR